MIEKKIAIISPSFFGYINFIKKNLEQRGNVVCLFDERHSNNIFWKIFYRLGFHKYFNKFKIKNFEIIYDAILREKFEEVLLIDVEVVDYEFIVKLRGVVKKISLFTWDSVRNKPGYLKYRHLLDYCATFDKRDADDWGINYVPLYSSLKIDNSQLKLHSEREIDVYGCFTLHSSRSKYILKFLKKTDGVLNVKFDIFYHSKLLLILKCFFSLSTFKLFKHVKFKPFAMDDIYENYKNSKFVLDLPHPMQTGYTMRAFETLMCGAYLITNMNSYDRLLWNRFPKRVISYDNFLQSNNFNFGKDCCLNSDDEYFLSIDRFIDQIGY
jgi:hypothetical protein